jgi:hypothetical protein
MAGSCIAGLLGQGGTKRWRLRWARLDAVRTDTHLRELVCVPRTLRMPSLPTDRFGFAVAYNPHPCARSLMSTLLSPL